MKGTEVSLNDISLTAYKSTIVSKSQCIHMDMLYMYIKMMHVYVQLDFASQGNPTKYDLHLTHPSLSSLHRSAGSCWEAEEWFSLQNIKFFREKKTL